MPAKKTSAGAGGVFSKQSFFVPGRGADGGKIPAPPSSVPFNNHKPKVKKVSISPAGPGMMFSKQSFFLPGRGDDGGKVPVPVAVVQQAPGNQPNRFEPQRRFVLDKSTGEPYAEWINGVAVCIHTGQELFRSRTEVVAVEMPFDGSFDYSVPKQRHPNDYSIDTNDMVASGFLKLSDFKAPHGAAVRLVDYENYLKRKREEEDGM